MTSSKGTQIIKKDNRLIEAKYKLTIHEQRLLFILLEKITIEDTEFNVYEINLSEIAEKFDLNSSNSLYLELQEAADALLTKRIKLVDTDSDSDTVTWLSRSKYKKGSGRISIEFHQALKPYLLQLKSHFTQYQISAVAQFKSSYSIRFYELLKMYEYLGKGGQFYREFTLQELREYMQIEQGEYQLFADFRRYVIEASVKEINSFSDMNVVEVEYIKSGRAVSEVRITAEPKNPKNQIILDTQEAIEDSSEALSALVAFGIVQETAQKWAQKFGKARVLRNVAYTLAMKEAGQVKVPILYLSKALEEDYGNSWEAEKAKQKAAIKKAKIEAQAKEQADEKKLEKQRKEREETLTKFSALSDTEKEALRDMYAATLGKSAMLANWKKAGDEPEKQSFFLATFPIYLKQNDLV